MEDTFLKRNVESSIASIKTSSQIENDINSLKEEHNTPGWFNIVAANLAHQPSEETSKNINADEKTNKGGKYTEIRIVSQRRYVYDPHLHLYNL